MCNTHTGPPEGAGECVTQHTGTPEDAREFTQSTPSRVAGCVCHQAWAGAAGKFRTCWCMHAFPPPCSPPLAQAVQGSRQQTGGMLQTRRAAALSRGGRVAKVRRAHLCHFRPLVALDGGIQLQVLSHRQVRPQHIVLRADPQALSYAAHLGAHVKAVQDRMPAGGGHEACEDVDECGLAGPASACRAHGQVWSCQSCERGDVLCKNSKY